VPALVVVEALFAGVLFAGVDLVPVDFVVVSLGSVAVSLAAVVRADVDLAAVADLAADAERAVVAAVVDRVAVARLFVGVLVEREVAGWPLADSPVDRVVVDLAVVVRLGVALVVPLRVEALREVVELAADRPAELPADLAADRELAARAAADRDEALALDPAVAAFFAEVRRDVVDSRTPESEPLVLRAGMLAVVSFRVREVAAATRSPPVTRTARDMTPAPAE
jgi:hypothetical protein